MKKQRFLELGDRLVIILKLHALLGEQELDRVEAVESSAETGVVSSSSP